MRFGYTILYVEDVARSIAFYRDALGLALKFVDPTTSFAEFATGETALALCSRAFLRSMGKPVGAASLAAPASEIAFVTDDPGAAAARAVAAGATPVQAAEVMEWGQTTAYVADPDGFLIEFCTPMAT